LLAPAFSSSASLHPPAAGPQGPHSSYTSFNQVVADATHFGVGREGNAEITPLIGSLKVVEVK
jgi:hypothetical protein